MRKRLILMRHGEAQMPFNVRDKERSLTLNGTKEAFNTASQLVELGWSPEIIFSSDGTRTLQTTEQVLKTLPDSVLSEAEPSLYLASEGTLLHFFQALLETYNTVAIVGHNPGLSYAVENLTNQYVGLPTANAVLIEFEVDKWLHIDKGLGTLVKVVSPLDF